MKKVAFALGLALAPPAWACGHCVEDKIASVYDHAEVTRVAESVRGVVRGSARVPFAALEKQLQYMLAPQGVALLTLRVLERPAELKTISRR